MSEKIRPDCKIGFQNTFYTKCINVIIDSIGSSIILRSIYNFFPVLVLLTNHETLYNLDTVLRFLGQSLPFLQLQVCDKYLYM